MSQSPDSRPISSYPEPIQRILRAQQRKHDRLVAELNKQYEENVTKLKNYLEATEDQFQKHMDKHLEKERQMQDLQDGLKAVLEYSHPITMLQKEREIRQSIEAAIADTPEPFIPLQPTLRQVEVTDNNLLGIELEIPETDYPILPVVNSAHRPVKAPPVGATFLNHIETPDLCYTVAMDRTGELLHGGRGYNSLSLNLGDKSIQCIRVFGRRVIMLEGDKTTGLSHVVSYKQNPNTEPKTYSEVSRIKVHNAEFNATYFVRVKNFIAQTCRPSGRVLIYCKVSGELVGEVRHPEMQSPRGLCCTENGMVYVTDSGTHAIFSFDIVDPEITIKKITSDLSMPLGIAIHSQYLLVSSFHSKLYVLDMKGKLVGTVNLLSCDMGADMCVRENGKLIMSNYAHGIRSYQLNY